MIITEEIIHGWRGVRLTAGDVSVGLTPDIGGRIMSLAFRGQELLYAHAPQAGRVFDFPEHGDIERLKREIGFPIFGGDRTWVAPESAWVLKAPPLELDAGRYVLTQQGGVCVMTSPVCRETGLRIVRWVRLEENGTLRLIEEFHNMTDRPLQKGIWSVSQVPRPFDVFVPAEPEAMRAYFHEDPTLPDPQQSVERAGRWAKVPCCSSVCFKFGGLLREGRVILAKTFGERVVLWGREFDYDPAGDYAHRSAVEVFNSGLFSYGELEVHAPLSSIAPGKSVVFHQCWRLGDAPIGSTPEEFITAIFPSI